MNQQNHDLAAQVDKTAANIESAILAVLGRAASWVAPVPVAVMTSRALVEVFDIGPFWAGLSAVALELVGMTTSALWLTLADYNRHKRKPDPAANAPLALGMMVAYFAVDFAIIVALAAKAIIANPSDWTPAIAALFPPVSAISVVVLNQRVQHYRRLARIETEKAEKARKRAQPAQPVAKTAPRRAKSHERREMLAKSNGDGASLTVDSFNSLLESHGFLPDPPSTARGYLDEVKEK